MITQVRGRQLSRCSPDRDAALAALHVLLAEDAARHDPLPAHPRFGDLHVPQRLWRQAIEAPSGCWIWVGQRNGNGYGRTGTGSRKDGTRRQPGAHRVLFELLVGPVPDGLELDHLCRVRRCVNPNHLEPVTREENQRRAQMSRAQSIACAQGHPWSPENTRRAPAGHRECRACGRAKWRRQRDRRRSRA